MHHNHLSRAMAILALFAIAAGPLAAQTTYGSIVGSARDVSGAMMPGVKITVTNESTGESHARETNEAGVYALTTLYPGNYRLRGEMSGFRAVDIKGITLQVNQTARFDVTMEVGQVTESIEVAATAPVLATDTSDVGQVINNKQIVDLPLNGRNFMQLASLTNGVILSGTTESGGPNFLSEGGRPTQNSFLVEGVETRIQREGRYGLNLSVDAIGEFKMMQNAFSAEFGRGATIVNSTIKSGGNDLHGSAFEFLRNNVLDARNAFDLTGVIPPLRLNQFGASAGGPIRRDKTFFFVNYEGQRVRRGTTRYANVPTPAMLSGDLSGMATAIDPDTGLPFPGNQVPQNRFSQFAKAGNPYYPQPNSTTLPNLNYVAVISNPTTMNQGTTRIDHNLTTRDRLNGHVTFFWYETLNIGTMPYSGTQNFSKVRPNLSVEHTHTFNPNLLNNFRFGYSYTDSFTGPYPLLDHDVTREFGLQNLKPEANAYAPPQINIQGFGSPGSGAWIPQGAIDVNTQFVEQLSYFRGRHALKAGADLRLLRYDDLGYATQNGYYNFTNSMYSRNQVADYLLGLPQQAFANQSGGRGFQH